MTLPERPLGDALRLASNPVPVRPDQQYRITGIYSFGRGLIRRPTISGSETAYPALTRVHAGQLTMSKLNAWEGALAVVPEDFSGTYVSPEYPVFDIDESIAHPSYIAHLVKWTELWQRLTPRGSMVRRKRTNPSTLTATMVPLPDLDEQRRIAARLDSALGRLERMETLRQHRDLLRSALAESAVERIAARATSSTRIGSLVVASRTPVDVDPDEPYRAFGMRSFGKGTIRYPAAQGKDLSKLRYFSFPSGALVLSNIKGWEGAIGITGDDDAACIASNRFLFYSARDEKINLSYLRHYLLSYEGLAQVSACSPGSADRNRTLSSKRFEDMTVPLPRRSDQDRVAGMLDALGATFDPSRTMGTLEAIRPSLLNAAFGGRL